MRVHHVNCGAMRPWGGVLMDGVTPGLGASLLACRCLVLEGDDGLILVDTGVVGTSLAGAGTYLGPCAADHEYRYVLYALDEGWTGSAGTSMSTLLAEVEDHVLASAELRVSPSPEGS